jgi:hypothetical protein
MEVGLPYSSLVEDNLIVQGCPQAVADTALHLGADDVRIDGDAAVDSADHALDLRHTIISP